MHGSTVRSKGLTFPRTFLLLLFLLGCTEAEKFSPPASRVDAVKPANAGPSAKHFCDKVFPATGAEAKKFVPALLRPLGNAAKESERGSWTWVNVWATWCEPCREEMPLLSRFREALTREGNKVAIDLLSIDDGEAEDALKKTVAKGLPGPVSWVRSDADFGVFLDAMGVERSAAIPIHALVDPSGMLRCVRVGAIHDRDFGAVKAIFLER